MVAGFFAGLLIAGLALAIFFAGAIVATNINAAKLD